MTYSLQLSEIKNLLAIIDLEYPKRKDYFSKNEFSEYIDVVDFKTKKESSKDAFVRYLQNTCDTIDKQFIRFCKYVESKNEPIPENQFERLKDKYTKLKEKLNLLESELMHLGSSRRDYETVEFYDDINDGFDNESIVVNPHSRQLSSLYEFKDYFNSKTEVLHNKSSKKTKMQCEETNNFTFTNNFDHVSEAKVLEYFADELVKTKYITQITLEQFLISAFQEKQKTENRFSFLNIKTKQNIVNVFYRYYKIVAGKPHKKQINYIKLLGEYFEGFETKTIKTNFNK